MGDAVCNSCYARESFESQGITSSTQFAAVIGTRLQTIRNCLSFEAFIPGHINQLAVGANTRKTIYGRYKTVRAS